MRISAFILAVLFALCISIPFSESRERHGGHGGHGERHGGHGGHGGHGERHGGHGK
jgi:hypothetical protein